MRKLTCLDFLFVVIVSDGFFLLLVSHSAVVVKLRWTSSFDNHSMFYFPEGRISSNPVLFCTVSVLVNF